MSAMDIDTHPNPQPNLHHRKIDLQSPHDLIYLQNNLAKFALQKLDLHFPKLSKPATHISLDGGSSNINNNNNNNNSDLPPNTKPQPTNSTREEELDDEDPMRRRVHDLISQFLHTTWHTASTNITINGIDASTLPIPALATLSPPQSASTQPPSSPTEAEKEVEIEHLHFQYTPFDATLQRKLAGLHSELEALTAQVSRLRRTAPGQSAATYADKLDGVMAAEDARFERERDMLLREDVDGLEVEPVRDGWNEDVREVYERGVGELAGLAGVDVGFDIDVGGPSLTETVGKAQRAKKVFMDLD